MYESETRAVGSYCETDPQHEASEAQVTGSVYGWATSDGEAEKSRLPACDRRKELSRGSTEEHDRYGESDDCATRNGDDL
jgi:hypothetical protein